MQQKNTLQTRVNLLKPTGYVMHQRVSHSITVISTHPEVFCIYLTTNSGFRPIQHKLIDCYNRDERCGTDWVFNP
jgi:hypothetical protein